MVVTIITPRNGSYDPLTWAWEWARINTKFRVEFRVQGLGLKSRVSSLGF